MSKNYSNPSTYSFAGPLIKDPETESFKITKGPKAGTTVTRLKLTFVDGSGSDKYATIYPEVYVESEARRAYLGKLRKGDQVRFEGKPEIRVYSKKNGDAGFAFEIRFPRVVEPLVYLNDREDAAPEPDPDPSGSDDLPSPYDE